MESVHRGRQHVNILTLEQLTGPGAEGQRYSCARCDMYWIRFQQDSLIIVSTHRGASHNNVLTKDQLLVALQASLPEREPEPIRT